MDNADADEKTKLLIARSEIEAILRKHDICAHTVLIGRGRMEVIMNVDASWSNLTLVHDEEHGDGIRLRSQASDYGGDKEAQRQDLEATSGMVRGLGELLGMAGLAWLKASELFDEKTGAEHTAMKFEPKP